MRLQCGLVLRQRGRHRPERERESPDCREKANAVQHGAATSRETVSSADNMGRVYCDDASVPAAVVRGTTRSKNRSSSGPGNTISRSRVIISTIVWCGKLARYGRFVRKAS